MSCYREGMLCKFGKTIIMKNIGQKIKSVRESQGITQEELANEINLSLRTIQRIEKGENHPKRKTLNLILNHLEIDYSHWEESIAGQDRTLGRTISNVIYLALINTALVLIFGFLTLDSHANLNSRTGALIIALVVAVLINQNTRESGGIKRVLSYASGLILYCITTIGIHGFPMSWVTNLVPSVLIFIFLLNMRMPFLKNEIEA